MCAIIKIQLTIGETDPNVDAYQNINGFLFFKPSLRVIHDVLGQNFHFDCNSGHGLLYTPKLTQVDGKKEMISQPVECSLDLTDRIWGDVIAYPNALSTIETCYFTLVKKNANISFRQLTADFDKWLQSFRDTVSIVSGHFVRSDVPSTTIRPFGDEQFEFYYSGRKINTHGEAVLEVNDDVNSGINLLHFVEGINVASSWKKPKLQFDFLLSAWEEFLKGNYRRCVLDLATAFEICLDEILQEAIPGDICFKKEIANQYKSLSKKRKLCSILGVILPNHNYAERVDKLRNEAIHAGKQLTKSDAEEALQIVYDALKKLSTEMYELIDDCGIAM
ncbi:MAG: hypothetical protein ACO1OO_00395 [Flavisolibacter sp.]